VLEVNEIEPVVQVGHRTLFEKPVIVFFVVAYASAACVAVRDAVVLL
jgi:hypothetical protein